MQRVCERAAAQLSPWSDGWRAGDTVLDAALVGRFHARLTDHGACAWLGRPGSESAMRWPVGWRVRVDPAALYDQNGNLVAREGDLLTVGGGTAVIAHPGVRCGTAGQQVWDVEGAVQHGVLRHR